MRARRLASAPTGALAEAINSTFGSLEALQEKVNAAGAARFGSGWAWLVVNGSGNGAGSVARTALNGAVPPSVSTSSKRNDSLVGFTSACGVPSFQLAMV